MISRVLDALAAVVTQRRALVLIVLALTVAVLAYHIRYMRADFTPQDLFTSFEDQDRIIADFQEAFGTTDNVVIFLLRADNVLEPEALQYLHDLSLFARDNEFVERAESITVSNIPRSIDDADPADDNGGLAGLVGMLIEDRVAVDSVIDGDTVEPDEIEELRTALSNSPLLQNRLVSEDYDTATVAVFLESNLTRIQEFRAAVNSFRAHLEANPPPEGTEIRIAGLPYVRTVVVERFRTDQTVIVPLALFVCMLILMVTIRWAPGVYLPLAAVTLAAIMVVGGMGLFGEPINIVNNIVPALIIIIGISNSIHLVGRFREELRHGRDRQEATRVTVRAMAVACFLTSLTTAIGFASLLISRTELLQRFGVLAAIGVLVSYVVTITFLPVLFTWVKSPRGDTHGADAGLIERWVADLTHWILERPGKVLATAALVFGGSVFIAVTMSEIDNSVLDQFDERDEIVQTTRLLESELEGVMPIEISFAAEDSERFASAEFINELESFGEWALEQEAVLSASSYGEYLHEAWVIMTGETVRRETPFESDAFVGLLLTMIEEAPRNPISPYLTSDRRNARLSLKIADVGAQATIALGGRIEEEAAARFGAMDDVRIDITGDAYVNARGLDAVISDLVGSLLLAVVIIFGFLSLLFRSVRLGMLSVPPNIIPLVVTMAYMAARGIRLNTATAMIFSISIGMAVDATIHVMARFREESRRAKDLDHALVDSARGAGRAIVVTCVMLILGFSVMLISSFVPVRRFGELIAITAFGTLLGNLIVLPALLKVGFERMGIRSKLFDVGRGAQRSKP